MTARGKRHRHKDKSLCPKCSVARHTITVIIVVMCGHGFDAQREVFTYSIVRVRTVRWCNKRKNTAVPSSWMTCRAAVN